MNEFGVHAYIAGHEHQMQSLNDTGRHYIISGAVGELGRGEDFDDSNSGHILQFVKTRIPGFVNFYHEGPLLIYKFIDATTSDTLFTSQIDITERVFLPTTTTTAKSTTTTSTVEKISEQNDVVELENHAVRKKGDDKNPPDPHRAKKVRKAQKKKRSDLSETTTNLEGAVSEQTKSSEMPINISTTIILFLVSIFLF
jgi:hypothetical protein